jgi:hypothetical protein
MNEIINFNKSNYDRQHKHISLYEDRNGRRFYIKQYSTKCKFVVYYAHKNGVGLNPKEFTTFDDAKKYLFENHLDLILGDRSRIAKLTTIKQKEDFIKKFKL